MTAVSPDGRLVAMLTGRRASQTGYSKTHPLLLDFNPTLASVLADAGYETADASLPGSRHRMVVRNGAPMSYERSPG